MTNIEAAITEFQGYKKVLLKIQMKRTDFSVHNGEKNQSTAQGLASFSLMSHH